MSSVEINKIVAAILTAGVVAMSAGFIADLLTKAHELDVNVYQVAAGGAAAGDQGGDQGGDRGEAPAEPAIEAVSPLLAAADLEAGAKGVRKCSACHTFDQGGANRIGPNLWNIVNRAMASGAGFGYSATLQGMADGRWGYEELNAFLIKPKDYAPGTKMSFAGIKKIGDRVNLIAHLRTLSDSPAALPE